MSGYNGFVPGLTCIQIKILKEHVNIFQYSLRIFHLRVFFCIFNKIVFYSGIEAYIAFDGSFTFRCLSSFENKQTVVDAV